MNRRKMIRSRQVSLVMSHDPLAGLAFCILQHLLKTIIVLGPETPCNRLVQTPGLLCHRAYSLCMTLLIRHDLRYVMPAYDSEQLIRPVPAYNKFKVSRRFTAGRVIMPNI